MCIDIQNSIIRETDFTDRAYVINCNNVLRKGRQTTDNQFGFKSGHSTDLCVYALTEFIEYLKRRSTSVYVAFLDASKAFDKINHWALFKKVLNRCVLIYLVKVLCYIIIIIATGININQCMSNGDQLFPVNFK